MPASSVPAVPPHAMPARMSGHIASLRLPDDFRLHVQFSTYFHASTLARLRRDLLANRDGIAVVEVATPIVAPLIKVALDRRSLYLRGFHAPGASAWWAFKEGDYPLPTLPGMPSRSMGLTGNYRELGLPDAINMRPERLLGLLAAFDGRPDPEFCRAIVLLLFMVPEALRFDSVLMECARYFAAGTQFSFTLHPARFADTVRGWEQSRPGDRNVLVPHLP